MLPYCEQYWPNINQYKQIRPIIQLRAVYRLLHYKNDIIHAVEYQYQSKCILFIFLPPTQGKDDIFRVSLFGLEEECIYTYKTDGGSEKQLQLPAVPLFPRSGILNYIQTLLPIPRAGQNCYPKRKQFLCNFSSCHKPGTIFSATGTVMRFTWVIPYDKISIVINYKYPKTQGGFFLSRVFYCHNGRWKIE